MRLGIRSGFGANDFSRIRGSLLTFERLVRGKMKKEVKSTESRVP